MQIEIERVRQQDNVQTKETEILTINMPQGIDDGETIIIKNKGHNISSVCGDVKLIVRVTNDTEFTRNGIDLHFKKNITLKEALCGCKFKLDHISGNQIGLNVNVVIYTGAKQVIKNFGMIKDGKVGDFVIEFNVTFPETLTQEQKDELSKIL
jgi:DnaJ family protein B protein 4